jgi:3-keto-L-gulonate-6-phosphate decarboxylase
MCDMAATPRATGQRTAEVDQLGVDYIMVPTGYIPEYDYDLEAHRGKRVRTRVRPLDLAGVVKRNARKAKLALHTGINESNISDVVKMGPELVLVGRAILDAPDKALAAERLKRYMPFEG